MYSVYQAVWDRHVTCVPEILLDEDADGPPLGPLTWGEYGVLSEHATPAEVRRAVRWLMAEVRTGRSLNIDHLIPLFLLERPAELGTREPEFLRQVTWVGILLNALVRNVGELAEFYRNGIDTRGLREVDFFRPEYENAEDEWAPFGTEAALAAMDGATTMRVWVSRVTAGRFSLSPMVVGLRDLPAAELVRLATDPDPGTSSVDLDRAIVAVGISCLRRDRYVDPQLGRSLLRSALARLAAIAPDLATIHQLAAEYQRFEETAPVKYTLPALRDRLLPAKDFPTTY